MTVKLLAAVPLTIPVAWFDNSTGNPANPDPKATVRWGSQTDDEMMIGYVEYYRVNGEVGREK